MSTKRLISLRALIGDRKRENFTFSPHTPTFAATTVRLAILAKTKTFPLRLFFPLSRRHFTLFRRFHNRLVHSPNECANLFRRQAKKFLSPWTLLWVSTVCWKTKKSTRVVALASFGYLKSSFRFASLANSIDIERQRAKLDDILILYVIFFIHTLFMQVSSLIIHSNECNKTLRKRNKAR